MGVAFWVTAIVGLLSFGAWILYYTSLGKWISHEEKEAGRDLSNEINPFTGSSKKNKK